MACAFPLVYHKFRQFDIRILVPAYIHSILPKLNRLFGTKVQTGKALYAVVTPYWLPTNQLDRTSMADHLAGTTADTGIHHIEIRYIVKRHISFDAFHFVIDFKIILDPISIRLLFLTKYLLFYSLKVLFIIL